MFTTRSISARFPDLAGKTALVTGAAGGIGHGICLFLLQQGMKVAASDYSEDRLKELEAAIAAAGGGDYVLCPGDLSSREGAQRGLDACTAALGAPDVLINGAARLNSGHFLRAPDEIIEETTQKNIRLCYFISRLTAEAMAARGGGRIINISSIGAERAHEYQALYDASKGAIHALTRSMAVDLAASNIRVNAIVPGATRSPVKHRNLSEKWLKNFAEKDKMIPVGRMCQPEDVAAMAAFLASDAADYITGAILHVDGGISAQLAPPGLSI